MCEIITHDMFTRKRAEKLAAKAAIAKATGKDSPYVAGPYTMNQLMGFAESAVNHADLTDDAFSS